MFGSSKRNATPNPPYFLLFQHALPLDLALAPSHGYEFLPLKMAPATVAMTSTVRNTPIEKGLFLWNPPYGKKILRKMTVFRRVSVLVAAAVLLQALMADRCDADQVRAPRFLFGFPGCFQLCLYAWI